jgi:hypothetical protein
MVKTSPLETVVEAKNTSFLEKVFGGICLALFVATWIASLASPVLFLVSLAYEFWLSALFCIVVTVLAYAPWQKGRAATTFQRFVARYTPHYFKSCRIVMEQDEGKQQGRPQQQQTLFAIHPHGVFCIGWGVLYSSNRMQQVRFCFAPALYASPFFRLFSRCTGNPGSAARRDMISYIKAGESLALPPGGLEEATISCTDTDRVFIKKRTGFIRLCLEHGIAVRPVYVFGEKSFFWNIQGNFSARLALNRRGIPAVFFWGYPLFPVLPKNSVEMLVVIGTPIILPRIEEPSKEEVKQWHDKYVAALVKLFEHHKEAAYGRENAKIAKLELW